MHAAHAHAFEAGWMQIQTAGATPDAPTTTVDLYYPTMAAPRIVAMGPFSVAALRHPGDNWQDRSLMEKGPERYFDERPRRTGDPQAFERLRCCGAIDCKRAAAGLHHAAVLHVHQPQVVRRQQGEGDGHALAGR